MLSLPFVLPAAPLPAAAQPASAGGGASMLPMLLMLVAILVVFWLFSRSQRKKQQQAMSFRDRLQPGQEVMTIGRLVGTVKWIKDDRVMIETGPNTFITVMKEGIARLIEPETDEIEDEENADGASVVTEAEAVVSEASKQNGSATDKAADANDEDEADDEPKPKPDTIMLNGEEVSREDLEGGEDGPSKGKKK